MKMLIALVFAVLALGCGPRGRVVWPAVLECAPEISDLIASVSRVLLGDGPRDQVAISDRGKGELEELARDHGPEAVACVTERIVHDWTAPGAAREPLRLAAAARGQDFLRKVGSRPQLTERW